MKDDSLAAEVIRHTSFCLEVEQKRRRAAETRVQRVELIGLTRQDEQNKDQK